ncbi:pyridoxal phosphatase [Aliivibrio fischeri]|uniref:Hydrolase n=1 Tax=Aliivibrio fischeri SR5 TaxID=1088719 RepID=A0AAV3ERA7_ALIFS|nr:pyridoxal phosphatase [Aliivibrio fischeri]EHN69476.1 hydrolase [Aliivibrio fischeri SR5]MUK25484.1 pyridoxal phosphatase [Aliivibrio fischeri]MUK33059.1 pyridoxal phosphatase [Aliivibrio fischeri]
MYKVLALDLDGTVLTDNHTIHPEVKKAIQEVKKYCHVVIVTGRHHTAARPYYYELGLDTPIICCNGTYVYDYQSETVLKQNAIEKQNALTFIDMAEEFQLKMVMYITNAMTYSNYNPFAYMLVLEEWAATAPKQHRPQIYRVDSFIETANQAEHVWKFVVEGEQGVVDSLLQHPWVESNFNGERSWSNRIDFAAKGNSKGLRLSEYISELGYQASDVIAVGDNHNDISMLKYAGLGVAMLNADDIVKSHAQAVCSTNNNNDGLAHLIREQIKG